MRFLQVGLGSMGKRRIRNLRYLGVDNIVGYDIRKDRVEEAKQKYGIQIIDNFEHLKWDEFTHVSISTPPDKHVYYAEHAIKNDLHTFIEASVIVNGLENLNELQKSKKIVVAPSCTMKFDPIVVKAKEVLESEALGKLIFASHHFGQYLPNWHPYENIKDFYVSKKETGAAREIVPFDLIYITWLLGQPTQMVSLRKNSGSLGVEIDDIYSLLLNTQLGCQIQFSIDVTSKVSYRDTRIVCSNGNIELDNVKGSLKVFNGESKLWKFYHRDDLSITHSKEEMYVLEMECFINSTRGKSVFPHTLSDDIKILNYLNIAEESFNSSKILEVF
ncbi:MAG: Gfo/Idh/MocA family oxidoreductase [Bdellovibrionaceae bacterium]|nr:Gfo/Idh/MocA family oxidoreductase [Pseudobdellovibrionaceae bacterium]